VKQIYSSSGLSGFIVFIPSGQDVYFFAVTPFGSILTGATEYRTTEAILQSFKPSTSNPASKALKPLLYKSNTATNLPAVSASSTSGYRLPFIGYTDITNGPYVAGCNTSHSGRSSEAIDFALSYQNVIATQAGNIVYAAEGWNDGFGNLLKIDHGDGNTSYSAHLSSFKKTSGSVSKGESVAISGSTGNSTGPHLHFEVRDSSNQSTWIRTLPGITWYSGDPNYPCRSGQTDGYAVGPEIVITPPGPFNKVSPTNGTTGTGPTVTLHWNTTSNGAERYYYCYNTSSTCASGWNSVNQDNTTTLSNLSPGTTYYWQALAWNQNGEMQADGGTWWSFTTASSDIYDDFEQGLTSNWTVIGSGVDIATDTPPHNNLLRVTYLGQYVDIIRNDIGQVAAQSNLVYQIDFWDDPTRDYGLDFYVSGSGSNNYILFGVNNSYYGGYYFQRNGTTAYNTGIPRTYGWHLIQIFVTDGGSYLKIDGQQPSGIPNLTTLTHATEVGIEYPNWGKGVSLSYWDNFSVHR
jgi:murein DD-endopeptidase MepM/ murein hydrolase activator NlpD